MERGNLHKVGDKRYDILSDFTKIKEETVKQQATSRWTPEELKSLHPEHPELFYACILGKVVISSITDEFYTTLQNYAGDELASDDPLLLWLILTHFHTSTVTYHEGLKQQIRTRDLASDHQHDIESYLIRLRHQVDVLRSTSVSPKIPTQIFLTQFSSSFWQPRAAVSSEWWKIGT
jgi:hypothetical protein